MAMDFSSLVAIQELSYTLVDPGSIARSCVGSMEVLKGSSYRFWRSHYRTTLSFIPMRVRLKVACGELSAAEGELSANARGQGGEPRRVSAGDCACPVCIQGCISVTRIALKCATVTAKRMCDCHLDSRDPPRPDVCASAHSNMPAEPSESCSKRRRKKENTRTKKHLRETSSTSNDPCLFISSKSSENTLAWISQICVFGRTCESTNRYARAQTAI